MDNSTRWAIIINFPKNKEDHYANCNGSNSKRWCWENNHNN